MTTRRTRMVRHGLGLVLALLSTLSAAAQAPGAWSYSVEVTGRNARTSGADPELTAIIGSALGLWTQHLAGGAGIEIEVEFNDLVPRSAAHALTSTYVRTDGANAIYEQGVAYEIRTGVDPNGALPDVRILVNGDYFYTELWFDPAPTLRSTPVPVGRIDAVSLFAHEIGHALAYNGWWDVAQGLMPLGYGSTWDANTLWDGSMLFFVGARAMSFYGGPVPVTTGNNWHVGNATGPGVDLLDDLMNGVQLERGRRYDVSPLNLAMLADMGLPLAPVPEPPATSLLLMGLLALAAWARRRSERRAGAR